MYKQQFDDIISYLRAEKAKSPNTAINDLTRILNNRILAGSTSPFGSGKEDAPENLFPINYDALASLYSMDFQELCPWFMTGVEFTQKGLQGIDFQALFGTLDQLDPHHTLREWWANGPEWEMNQFFSTIHPETGKTYLSMMVNTIYPEATGSEEFHLAKQKEFKQCYLNMLAMFLSQNIPAHIGNGRTDEEWDNESFHLEMYFSNTFKALFDPERSKIAEREQATENYQRDKQEVIDGLISHFAFSKPPAKNIAHEWEREEIQRFYHYLHDIDQNGEFRIHVALSQAYKKPFYLELYEFHNFKVEEFRAELLDAFVEKLSGTDNAKYHFLHAHVGVCEEIVKGKCGELKLKEHQALKESLGVVHDTALANHTVNNINKGTPVITAAASLVSANVAKLFKARPYSPAEIKVLEKKVLKIVTELPQQYAEAHPSEAKMSNLALVIQQAIAAIVKIFAVFRAKKETNPMNAILPRMDRLNEDGPTLSMEDGGDKVDLSKSKALLEAETPASIAVPT